MKSAGPPEALQGDGSRLVFCRCEFIRTPKCENVPMNRDLPPILESWPIKTGGTAFCPKGYLSIMGFVGANVFARVMENYTIQITITTCRMAPLFTPVNH